MKKITNITIKMKDNQENKEVIHVKEEILLKLIIIGKNRMKKIIIILIKEIIHYIHQYHQIQNIIKKQEI